MADFKRQKGFTEFFFQENEKMKSLVKEFYSLKAAVEPNKYAQSIRALKGVIHSAFTESTSNQDQTNEFINEQKKGSR